MSDLDQNVSALRVLWRFRGYALHYKWHLAGVYVCLIATTGFALVIPRLLGNAIDETLASGLSSQQLVLAGTILMMGLLRALFGWAQLFLTDAVSHMGLRDLRNDIFDKLLGLGVGYYDRQRTGDLISRAMIDAPYSAHLAIRSLSPNPPREGVWLAS